MKYWEEGRTETGHGDNGFLLTVGDVDRIFSIVKKTNGNVVITEECDAYFSIELTKDDAVAMFKEAIDIVNT